MELTSNEMETLREEFYADDKNRFALNVVSRSDPLEACLSRLALETTNHVFNHKVDEVKPVTSQKSSGRCWIFAVLNAMRVPFAKSLEMDELELSQSYLFFWDKVERANYFLNTIVSVYKRNPKEVPEGRLVSFLLSNEAIAADGGQWDMVTNLIEKHGVMPKDCFPETTSNENSRSMNRVLKSKLREYAHELYKAVEQDASEDSINDMIKNQMKTVYRIIGICLGIPPKEFTWEYTTKSKKAQKIGPVTPLAFYNDHVKKCFDVADKVCIVTDPRPNHPTGQTYTVDCLGNVVGAKPILYNNQSIETLMDLASKSIMAGEPVWFGCDVSKYFSRKRGLLTMDLFDFELVFGTKIANVLSKADRLVYGDCAMNHAMVLTGVHEQEGQVSKWRIENSWGKDSGHDGYITMTTEWFKEWVFEIVVDKSHCPKEVLDAFQTTPTVLPAWDPMGSLALSE